MSDKVTPQRVEEIRHLWTTPPRNYTIDWCAGAINILLAYIDQQSAPAPVETVGDFGEPWKVDIQGCDLVILSNSGLSSEICHEIVNQYGSDTLEVNRFKRICDCVNALAGIKDPQKFRSDMETALAAKERECEELRKIIERSATNDRG